MILPSENYYVPLLRWKAAEQSALSNLLAQNIDEKQFTPIVEINPDSFHFPSETSLNVINELTAVAKSINKYWLNNPIFVDLNLLPNSYLHLQKRNPISILSNMLNGCIFKNCMIPVAKLKKNKNYHNAIKKAHLLHDNGVALRIEVDKIISSKVSSQIKDFLGIHELSLSKVDLIIDVKESNLSLIGLEQLYSRIPFLDEWRNLIVLSGAFPPTLGDLRHGENFIERGDWLWWTKGVKALVRKGERLPIYGDYHIRPSIYRVYSPEEKKKLDTTASIRYTSNNDWVVFRGKSIRRSTEKNKQFLAHSVMLVDQDYYCGKDFSYGDNYCYEKAQELSSYSGVGKLKTGNTSTWLTMGINHHLTFVVNQLASFSYS